MEYNTLRIIFPETKKKVMLYTVVASKIHIFTHFSLLNETDYQIFCATYVSHQESVSIISKNK